MKRVAHRENPEYLKTMDVGLDNCSYSSNRHFNNFCLSDILPHFKNPKGSGRNDELKTQECQDEESRQSHGTGKEAPAKNKHTDKGT